LARPRLVVLATLHDLERIATDSFAGDLLMTAFGDTLDTLATKRLTSECDVVPVIASDVDDRTVADLVFDPNTAAAIRAKEALFTKAQRRAKSDQPPGAPPMLFRLLTTPVRPLALGRSHRVVPGWLRDLITLRDQHCVVDGCEVPAHRCEVHHVQSWLAGGRTDVENLALLCMHHHRKVVKGAWHLRPRAAGDGPGRYWIAESDFSRCLL